MVKVLLDMVGRWKWALLYTGFILSMLPLTPTFLRATRGLIPPPWVQPTLVFLAVAGWTLFIIFAALKRPAKRLPRVVLLLVLGAIYAVLFAFVIHFPVERFHLVEYGLLGVLAWRAVSDKEWIPLRCWHTAAFIAAASLADEFIQGLMPGRFFDGRDFMINVLAGLLGAAVVSVAGWGRSSGGLAFGSAPHRFTASDMAAVLVLATVIAVFASAGRRPFDASRLAGTWWRTGECAIVEEVTFDGSRSFTWRDESGNTARGRYALEGNLLDGPRLDLVCTRAENRSGCGFQAGFRAKVYITIDGERFFFNDAPDLPLNLRPNTSEAGEPGAD